MKIMSFNVLCSGKAHRSWKNRVPLVVKTIRKRMPDSFGLQEAHKEWMDAICEQMPEYDFVGVGRDDGITEGEFSPVFYLKDKYSVVDSGSFWLSETPEEPSFGWDAACIRICSYALLHNRETDELYVHMNTHLDHIGAQAQLNGAKLIVERIKELFPDVDYVLTGDFNVLPDSEPYRALTSGGVYDSRALAVQSDSSGTYHNFDQIDVSGGSSIIDYIFTGTPGAKVDVFEVIKDRFDGEAPSDHNPVYAQISFEK